jgi:hypothetical protein
VVPEWKTARVDLDQVEVGVAAVVPAAPEARCPLVLAPSQARKQEVLSPLVWDGICGYAYSIRSYL